MRNRYLEEQGKNGDICQENNILQKYTSQWTQVSASYLHKYYELVFTVYLGMAQIFIDSPKTQRFNI